MPKRQGYRFGVSWIAENDDPCETDPDIVSGYISTLLLSDLFGKDSLEVAADIVRERKKATKGKG